MSQESRHFYAYTDGSTNPKISSPNSGCGAVISDSEHNVLWSGGMIVRADGNNFIPEVAAASCVIQALPKNKSLTLRSDSLIFSFLKENEFELQDVHGLISVEQISSKNGLRLLSNTCFLIKELNQLPRKEMIWQTKLPTIFEPEATANLHHLHLISLSPKKKWYCNTGIRSFKMIPAGFLNLWRKRR